MQLFLKEVEDRDSRCPALWALLSTVEAHFFILPSSVLRHQQLAYFLVDLGSG